MGRGLATLVLVALCGVAAAEPTRKVEIMTEPPGATVYLDNLDAGEACSPTPCTVNAPMGRRTSVIARKNGFIEGYGQIDLRHGTQKTLSITLDPDNGTLVCDDPGLGHGTILIDDVQQGKAPTRLTLDAAGHHVVVISHGRTVFDDFVKVVPGQEYVIKPNQSEPAPQPPKETPDVATADNATDAVSDDSTAKVTKHADTESHDMWIAFGGVFEVGFRQFKYSNPQNLAPTEDEGGQVLLGPSVQFWPMRLADSTHLRGLSIYAKVLFGANSRQVLQEPNDMPTGATTLWGNIEIDVQHRWELGDVGAVEIGGGFVRDQLDYNGVADNVPYADYMSMRIGVRGSLHVGPVEPYAQVEGRIPFSEGVLATRFATADVTGGGAAAGLAGVFGPIVVRAEASLVYYSWTLTNATTGPMVPSATGARDVLEGISLLVGASF